MELLRIADKYLQNNFVDVVESDEFLLLPVNQLIEMISADELNVKNEEQVYQAAMSWVGQNVPERKQFLGQLLSHVRLPLLNVQYLVTKVCSVSIWRVWGGLSKFNLFYSTASM
jgi:kelch-like protein 20